MRLPVMLSRLLLLGFFSFVLSACGGGGTGGPLDGGGDGSGGVDTDPQPSFAATGPGGVDLTAITLSFAESTEITLQVVDSTGAAIASELVLYSFDVPEPAPKTAGITTSKVVASGSVTTDPNGFANFPLIIDDPALVGTGTLTVTALGEGTTFDIEVTAAAGIPADIALALVDVNTGLPVTGIEFTSGARVEITVTEADGSALSENIIVGANATAGTVSPSDILITGGTGSFIVSRTDGIVDFFAVQVDVSVDVEDVSGSTTTVIGSLLSEFLPSGATGGGGAAGVPSSLFPVPFLQDPAVPGVPITAISSTDPAELVVTVVDFAGDPVANAIVSVLTDLGTLAPALGNVLTDAAGIATIDLSAGAGESGAAGTLTISVGNDLQFNTNFEIVDSGNASNSGLLLSLQLFNSTDGTATTTVNSVEPGLLVATLTNVISGLPEPGQIIEISVDRGEPLLTPNSGEILTDTNGEASILVGVGSSEAGAAISLLADVADLSTAIQFSVGNADIEIGRDPDGDYSAIDPGTFVSDEIDVDAMGGNSISLAATGSTTLRVGVLDVDDGSLFDTPLTVNFESNCIAAQVDTGVITVNGVATSTFNSAAACEGDVTVTASLVEISGATATGTITVAGSTANSIEFVSADPTNIAIKGTGGTGRQETSELTFLVVDDGGDPKQGETVNFALSTTLGGIERTNTFAISDANGLVTAIVSSGTVPTPVQVIATITIDPDPLTPGDEYDVSTVSDTLVISTGLPSQDAFSVSAEILNPGGGNVLDDGVESTITVRAADAFNNPAPDGTPISFTTEYGDIAPSCTTTDGACSVVWTSSAPRAVQLVSTGTMLNLENTACDYDQNGTTEHQSEFLPCPTHVNDFPLGDADDGLDGQVHTGRTTILAYALGDEAFVDSNGNGQYDYVDVNDNDSYDAGTDTLEPFVDLPEAFRDDNEDGVFGNETAAFDNNGDGSCTSDDGRDQCLGWQEGGQEEEFIDLDVDGLYDGDQDGSARSNDDLGDDIEPSVGNGIFNGVLCAVELEALDLCTTESVNVRAEVVLIMSDNTPVVDFRNDDAARSPMTTANVVDVSTVGDIEFVYVLTSDINNNLPVLGTTIEISGENCDIGGLLSYEIGNTNQPGISMNRISLSEDDSSDSALGQISVTATTTTTFNSGSIKVFFSSDTFFCEDAN